MAVAGPTTVSAAKAPAATPPAKPAKGAAPIPPAVMTTAPKGPVLVRCPRCGKAFERTEHVLQVCPNCGLRAPTTEPGERVMPEGVVGKPRRAWVVGVLTLVVQVVFWPLHLILLFRPLDKQHGRNHPIGAWLASIVPALGLVLAIPYAWMGLRRLQRSRKARGLSRGIGPFWFIVGGIVPALASVGFAVYALGTQGDLAAYDTFDTGHLANPLQTLPELPMWQQLVIHLGFFLPPAIVLGFAAASANKLWKEIYAERGEAWPWRTGVPDASEPATP